MFCTIEAYIDRHEALRQQRYLFIPIVMRIGNCSTVPKLSNGTFFSELERSLAQI